MTSCLTTARFIAMVRLSIFALAVAISIFDFLYWLDIFVKQTKIIYPRYAPII